MCADCLSTKDEGGVLIANNNATMEEILRGYGSSLSLPGYVRISLLEQCNQRCFFCHNEGYASSRLRTLDPELMWKVIDASLALGKNKFKFTGGEPTLDENLPEYVQGIKARDETADVGIVTNATNLSGLSQRLCSAGLDSAIVSLPSLDRAIYREITKFDALEDALAGIEALSEAGIKRITLNMPVTALNVDEVYKMAEFAQSRNYRLRLLDLLPFRSAIKPARVAQEELQERFPDLNIKPKNYHPKCGDCSSVEMCGEGNYLRLSAQGTLDPCLYRQDLKISVSVSDEEADMRRKVALGLRRIEYDDL